MVKGRNEFSLDGVHLRNASIHDAFAEGLTMRDAIISDSVIEEGDFSRANFSNTRFLNTRFNKTILTDAIFDGASFINCNLNRVNLANASFCVEEISETIVYGIAAWDLKTCDTSKQSRLVIERSYELYSDILAKGKVPLMVDDIEMAQFVYYLSSHKKMRNVLNVLNSKGVLLLGQFKDGGLDRLYWLRDWLKERNYTPMIFDFDRPDSLDYTETVITMAGLAKIIVADLSGGSVPHELHATMTLFQKPFIAYTRDEPYSMFKDLRRKNPYAVAFVFKSQIELQQKMEDVFRQAEANHSRIVRELADSDS